MATGKSHLAPDKLRTNHLQLVPGETKLFSVTRDTHLFGCGCVRLEDSMVVTDDRVLFLNRNWMFGACASSLEQAFYLCDLQAVNQRRSLAWAWAALAITCISIGARLLRAADNLKGMYDQASSTSNDVMSQIYGNYHTTMATMDTVAFGSYYLCIIFGILLLLLGIAALMVFLAKHVNRGVELRLDFSRMDVGILDWWGLSYWKPRMSSKQRMIKLPKETAQEAYDLLAGLLFLKHSRKSGKDGKLCDSAGGMA